MLPRSQMIPRARAVLRSSGAALLLGATPLPAASISYFTNAPAPGPSDISNFAGASQDRNNLGGDGSSDGSANDGATYVANNRPHQGQTFLTGTNVGGYRIKAVWLKHAGYTANASTTWWSMANGSSATVRVTDAAAAGSPAFALLTDTATTSGTEWGTTNALAPTGTTNTPNGTGIWVRFGLSLPVTLQPGRTYGFDVTSKSSGLFFETLGLRGAAAGGNSYANGTAYNGSTGGSADNAMNALDGDRVFMVELEAVLPPPATPGLAAEPFDPGRVRLLDGRFKSNQDLDRTGYLSSVTEDKLLYPFRANAGLPQPPGATSLGGWEGSSGFTAVRGHMAGHWLTAAARMYAATGDASLLPKIQAVVTELKKCQDALGAQADAAGRPLTGYLSAFPISFIEVQENSPGSAQVPFYTIHKILAGLVDAYRYAGVSQALDMAIAMSDYHAARMARLTAAQVEAMFVPSTGHTEWGGMNETLADLYRLSRARGDANPERHLAFARFFHREWFVAPLYAGADRLNGLHANTHIPQVVGFAHFAAALDPSDAERVRLYAAADNFWHTVVGSHWLVLGGNSYSEHFGAAGTETGAAGSGLTVATSETCNTHNMLKLTSELFQRNPAPEYADYYEHALYNHILASMAPDTGMFTYFVPMVSGHFKTYSMPEGSSWCCQGTGMENPARYGEAIYFHKDDTLWVNLYIASTLDWSEKGLSLRLETSMPQSGAAQLTVRCAQPTAAKIRLRIPAWISAAPTITVNGAPQNIPANASSYAELDRTWSDGDVVALTLPMAARIDRSMDDPSQVSLFVGPVLLAADLGTSGMPASDQAAGQLDYQAYARVAAPALVANNPTNLASWVQAETNPLTLTASSGAAGSPDRGGVTMKPFYDIHHTRYAVYWNMISPSAWSAWTGNGATAAWSSSSNWDASPAAQYGLRFAPDSGGSPTNDSAADTVYRGLEFAQGAGAFVLGGNRIGLQGDVRNVSSNAQRVNLPLAFQNGYAWFFEASGGDLTLGGALTGWGSLHKTGAYALNLLGDAAFVGSIKVAQGELQVGSGGSAGSIAETVPVILVGGSTLAFNRADNFSVSAPISGSGTLAKRGAGTMTLYSAASHCGPVKVEAGTLVLGSRQAQMLAHRWSFNGSLADSAGTNNATLVDAGTNNATLTATTVTLAGGARASSDYVSLGSNLVPKDGPAVTIELWATQQALQSWARIFDVGASTSENLFMSWAQATAASDRIEWKDGATATANNTVAPYALGTEHHIAMVIEPGAGAGGSTRVTWYAAPSSSADLGAAKGTFDTPDILANLTDTNFWLGRSEYASDATASASYNEVRVWKRAFGANELEALHDLGPDSVGTYPTQERAGVLPGATDLTLGPGAKLDLGAQSLDVASLAGRTGTSVTLGGGQLHIKAGGDAAAAFGGTFAGAGTIVNDGILRLVGDAAMPEGMGLVNNGTLDIMTWRGALPAGFINRGTVLGRDAVVAKDAKLDGAVFKVTVHGYAGHIYQLQACDDLVQGAWSAAGSPVPGADTDITFSGAASSARRFYRVAVDP